MKPLDSMDTLNDRRALISGDAAFDTAVAVDDGGVISDEMAALGPALSYMYDGLEDLNHLLSDAALLDGLDTEVDLFTKGTSAQIFFFP